MAKVSDRFKDIAQATRELMSRSLVWDDHLCMPLRPEGESFLPQLRRCRDAGYDVIFPQYRFRCRTLGERDSNCRGHAPLGKSPCR